MLESCFVQDGRWGGEHPLYWTRGGGACCFERNNVGLREFTKKNNTKEIFLSILYYNQ